MRHQCRSLPARSNWRAALALVAALTACNREGTTPDFLFQVSSLLATVEQGSSVTFTATGYWYGSGLAPVTFSHGPTPDGVSVSFSNQQTSSTTTSPTVTTVTVTISVAATTTTATYDIFLDAVAVGTTYSKTFTLKVVAPPVQPDFSLAATPSSVTLVQGTSTSTSVGVTAVGGFTGTVALTVAGAPTGLTVAFANPQATPAAPASLTITASSELAPGSYPLQVTGTSLFQVHTVNLSVTVNIAPSFTVTVVPPTGESIVQGGSGSYPLAISRLGGFSGDINLATVGLPFGVTGTFNPNPLPSSSNFEVLTLNVSSIASPGTTSFTITGTSGALTSQATAQVTVTQNFNVTFDFSSCLSTGTIPFAAFKDGSGVWVPMTGTAGIYHANITASTGAMTYVYSGGSFFQTFIHYYGQSDLVGATIPFCQSTPAGSGTTMTGTITGVPAFNQAYTGFGGASALAINTTTGLTFNNVVGGTQTLFGFMSDVSSISLANRIFILHGIPVTQNGSVGLLDFFGTNSAAPVSSVLPVGLLPGETATGKMSFYSGAACVGNQMWFTASVPSPFTVWGIPPASELAADFHALTVTTTLAGVNRVGTFWAHMVSGFAITLPAAPTGVSVVNSAVPLYKALTGTLNVPSAADIPSSEATLTYFDASQVHTVVVDATPGFVGNGTTVQLMTPNLNGIGVFNPTWLPAPAATVSWNIGVLSTQAAVRCVDGAAQKSLQISGTN